MRRGRRVKKENRVGGGRACGEKVKNHQKFAFFLAKNRRKCAKFAKNVQIYIKMRIFGEFHTFSANFCAFFSENA